MTDFVQKNLAKSQKLEKITSHFVKPPGQLDEPSFNS